MQNIKNKFNMPYDKSDLKSVLIKGLLTAFLISILASLLDYLIYLIQGNFFFGIIIISLTIGFMVKSSYKKYHILYPTLAVAFTILSMLFLHFFRYILLAGIGNIGYTLSHSGIYKGIFLYPIQTLIKGLQILDAVYIAIGLMTFVAYIVALLMSFFIARGKNR